MNCDHFRIHRMTHKTSGRSENCLEATSTTTYLNALNGNGWLAYNTTGQQQQQQPREQRKNGDRKTNAVDTATSGKTTATLARSCSCSWHGIWSSMDVCYEWRMHCMARSKA